MTIEFPLVLSNPTPFLQNTRPDVTLGDELPNNFWDDSVYDFLQAQGDRYRTTPVYTEAGSTYSHNWGEPIVAGRTMCAAPTVDGGYSTFSPNALVRDRWHDMRLVTTSGFSFTVSTPTGTVSIEALDRELKPGFVLNVVGKGYLRVTELASIGDTSLALMQATTTTVTVASSDVIIPANGYFPQQGCGAPSVENLMLTADPFQLMNPGFESARKYACDGVAVFGMGSYFNKLSITGFPGHGMFVTSPTNSDTLATRLTPWDRWECHLGHIVAKDNLAGITFNPTDGTFDTLIAAGNRDYGVMLNGYIIQGHKIHAYGNGMGVWTPRGGMVSLLESENNGFGWQAGSGQPLQVGKVRIYGNTYRGVVIDAYNSVIDHMIIQHASGATNGSPGDYHPLGSSAGYMYETGYALVTHGFSDGLQCPGLFITCTNGANGFALGSVIENNNHVLVGQKWEGIIAGSSSPGAYGLRIQQSMSACRHDLAIGGFANNLYYNNGVVLAGNTMHYRGVTGTTIRWPDGTTGTFGTPNFPSGVSSQVTFHVY